MGENITREGRLFNFEVGRRKSIDEMMGLTGLNDVAETRGKEGSCDIISMLHEGGGEFSVNSTYYRRDRVVRYLLF